MTGMIIPFPSHLLSSTFSSYLGGQTWPSFAIKNIILSFDNKNQTWTEVGQMNIERASHAVSVVNAHDVLDYCQ